MSKKGGGMHGGKLVKVKVKRTGTHAKTKTSKNKNSKLYEKVYAGQGR